MKKDPALMLLAVLVSFLFTVSVYRITGNISFPAPSLSFLADGEVEYIMLQKTDSFPLYFIHTGEQWHFTLDGSARYPLNRARFAAFHDELSRRHALTDTGIRDHRIHKTGDFADYVIVSGHSGGADKKISFGKPGADERFRYFSAGSTVYRTDNGIHPFLDNRTALWINLRAFDGVFDKTALQRAVLSQNGTIQHILPTDALKALQDALEGLYCVDITNIPEIPEQELVLELGNLSTLKIGFSRLSADYYLMKEDFHDVSWILSAKTVELLYSFFNGNAEN